MPKLKTSKQLERHFKGIANHRRIDILLAIDKCGHLSLQSISELLKCNFKTVAGHTKNLVNAGLLNKNYQGRSVIHFLSPYGKKIVEFIKKFRAGG